MTLTIEIPSDLVAKLENRARDEGLSDAGEYVRALIDADSGNTSDQQFLDAEDLAAMREADAQIDRGEGIDLATLRPKMLEHFAGK